MMERGIEIDEERESLTQRAREGREERRGEARRGEERRGEARREREGRDLTLG